MGKNVNDVPNDPRVISNGFRNKNAYYVGDKLLSAVKDQIAEAEVCFGRTDSNCRTPPTCYSVPWDAVGNAGCKIASEYYGESKSYAKMIANMAGVCIYDSSKHNTCHGETNHGNGYCNIIQCMCHGSCGRGANDPRCINHMEWDGKRAMHTRYSGHHGIYPWGTIGWHLWGCGTSYRPDGNLPNGRSEYEFGMYENQGAHCGPQVAFNLFQMR